MPLLDTLLRVHFLVIEPAREAQTFALGHFPLQSVLTRIKELDPASESYRIQDGLFHGEFLCMVYEDGPEPIIGAFYKDHLSKPLTEYKGEINEIELRDGEGLVDASYVAFLPDDVVGIIRTSNKAPGHIKVAQWLSVQGGHPLYLRALADANALAQLSGAQHQLRRLRLRLKGTKIPLVEEASPSVAQALRAAAAVSPSTETVGIDLAVRSADRQALWSSDVLSYVEELFELFDEFEEAKVMVQGRRGSINLKRAFVVASIPVILQDRRKVGPKEAAMVLFDAYEREQESIRQSVQRWRAAHEARPPDPRQ